jgi:hypothetical protein
MEVPAMIVGTVDRALFDEAVQAGGISAAIANRQHKISRIATDGIVEALALLKSGRAELARERLTTTLVSITHLYKSPSC